jgi:hypothetical protein
VSNKDTQIKYSLNRESAAFLLLLKKAALQPQPLQPLNTKRSPEQNAEEQAQAYIDQLMTVDELMDDFTMQHEEQLR